jgi:hypothetical protein
MLMLGICQEHVAGKGLDLDLDRFGSKKTLCQEKRGWFHIHPMIRSTLPLSRSDANLKLFRLSRLEAKNESGAASVKMV